MGRKQLYERFKGLPSDITHSNTWTCLRKGYLQRETESLLKTTQNNAIRTNKIKARIDITKQTGDEGYVVIEIKRSIT